MVWRWPAGANSNFRLKAGPLYNTRVRSAMLDVSEMERKLSSSSTSDGEKPSSNVVYNFDIEKYKKGTYQLICAMDPRLHLIGRFVRHPENARRKTKINTVQFDWPLCSFTLTVKGTKSVALRLKGKGES